MSFHVGQKVVFVGWPPCPWHYRLIMWFWPLPPDEFVVGDVYTVAHVYDHGRGRFALDLREVRCLEPGSPYLLGFVSLGFRPAVENKAEDEASIEILRKIARDITERKPVKITERA